MAKRKKKAGKKSAGKAPVFGSDRYQALRDANATERMRRGMTGYSRPAGLTSSKERNDQRRLAAKIRKKKKR